MTASRTVGRVAWIGLLGALTASCGGSENDSGTGLPIIPAPAQTPSPAPTPTPTPTPTPAPYQSYAQLSGDQSFQTGCVSIPESNVGSSDSLPLAASVLPFGAGPSLSYAAANQTWTIRPDPTDTVLARVGTPSFGPSERFNDTTSYIRSTPGYLESFGIQSTVGESLMPAYVRLMRLSEPINGLSSAYGPNILYHCVFGVPTRTDGFPTSSFAYSRVGMAGLLTIFHSSGLADNYAVSESQVTATLDVGASTMTITAHLLGAIVTQTGTSTSIVDFGTYTGTATLDQSGHYRGQISSSTRTTRSASFAGAFFGPQAGESAFAIGVDSLDPVTGDHLIFGGNAVALR